MLHAKAQLSTPSTTNYHLVHRHWEERGSGEQNSFDGAGHVVRSRKEAKVNDDGCASCKATLFDKRHPAGIGHGICKAAPIRADHDSRWVTANPR